MNINRPSDHIVKLPWKKYQEADGPHEKRLPGFEWSPNRLRNHFIAMIGEFSGTFMFLFFAFSATQVANAATANTTSGGDGSLTQTPNTSVLSFISLAFGFSLAVNAWVFFRISGGLFNPAVTLGMCMIGAVNWIRGGSVFLSQILGSMAASGVVSALFPGALNVATTLGGNTSIVRGLFIEMFLTAQSVFTIFMLAAEKHKGTFLAPIGIGSSSFIAESSGVYFTGGSLNPARSFGPCVVLHNFPGYHWIYWLGPALGSIVAVGFYRMVKILEYETANPGQDFNDKEAEVFNPDEDNAATAADVARPNVAVGRSEYEVDSEGIHRSRDFREGGAVGGAPRAPANYGRYDGARDSVGGTTVNAGSHDAHGHHDPEKQRHSDDQGHSYVPADRYREGPQAEAGDIGGRYRVSGL